MSRRSNILGRAGSITRNTASTAIGDRSDEYCDTTLEDRELREGGTDISVLSETVTD